MKNAIQNTQFVRYFYDIISSDAEKNMKTQGEEKSENKNVPNLYAQIHYHQYYLRFIDFVNKTVVRKGYHFS